MAIRDTGRMSDGVMSLPGGMDSGRSPSLLPKTQVAYAGNVAFRGGYPETRPSFKRVQLTDGTDEDAFTPARFQGAGYFEKDSSNQHLIAVAGGNVYRITPGSGVPWSVTDITNSVSLSATRERTHMIQANDLVSGTAKSYFIIQDGSNAPFIWDGVSDTSGRVSDTASDEVPIGSGPMAFGNGRLWVAQGREYVAGDIFGGQTGGVGGVLQFTENTHLAGGGAFAVSVGSGDITAMKFAAAPNSALGVGELLVSTADAVMSVNVPADRYDWYAMTDPVQRVMLVNNGCAGQHSTELVNGDVFMRSVDGIRSVVHAVREFQGHGNTPMSREMHRVLKYDNAKYLQYASAVLFNNRLLMTAQDNYNTATGIGFKGLVALDFDLISGMSGKAPAAYDGFWKLQMTRSSTLYDLDILQLVKGRFAGKERCFAFVRNESGNTELWELLNDGDDVEDVDFDSSGDPVEEKIQCEVELPSFDMGQTGAAKELESADMWVDRCTGGTVSFHADYHPDQYPCWISWQDWSIIAESTVRDESGDCSQSLVDYQKQYRPRMRIGRPADMEEPAAGKRMNYGWEFSARVKWTGHARLKMFRLNCRETQEEPYADVDSMDSTAQAIACDCLSGVSSATNQ